MSETMTWWTAFVLWLLLAVPLQWLFARMAKAGPLTALAGAVGVATGWLLLPWFGHELPFWTTGFCGTFSVPLAALLLAAIAGRVLPRPLLNRAEWRSVWTFGVVTSFLLYPSALGLGPRNFDAYALGWPWLFWGWSALLFGGVALASAVLIWRGSRFGLVLLLALLGYVWRFQESTNFWDYVQDPIYGILSMLVFLGWLGRGAWRRLKSPAPRTA